MDFRQALVNKTLAAEAGINGHHEEQINLVEERQHLGDGGGRVDGQADFFAERADFPNERRDLLVQFDVDDDLIRARLDEGFEENLRLAAHEVNVEEKFFGVRTDGGDDVGAERNVWHELAVHDVEVQPVGPGALGAYSFQAQMGEISGEQ